MTTRLLIMLLLIPLITSCMARPEVAIVQRGNEHMLNCPQIAQEMQIAERLKKDARKDDRFMFRYMLPINGILSIISMNRAENRATERMAYLEQLKRQKNCTNNYHQNATLPYEQQIPAYTNNHTPPQYQTPPAAFGMQTMPDMGVGAW